MSAATRVKLRPDAPGAWRRGAALGLMGVFAAAVLARAFYLQVVDKDFLTHEGDKRAVRTLVLQAAPRCHPRDRYERRWRCRRRWTRCGYCPRICWPPSPTWVAMAKMLQAEPVRSCASTWTSTRTAASST